MTRLPPGQMLLAYVAGSFGFGFQNLVMFLVPLRARELGAPLELIGVIVGIGALVPALLSVPTGEFADRVGPRKAFIVATAFSSVGALAFGATDSYWALLLVQPFHGLARTTGWIASQTYITGIGSPAERAAIAGRFSFSANLGPMLAPLLASAAAELFGYQASFLAVAAVGAIYTAIGLALPEVAKRPAGKDAGPAAQAGFGAALELLRLSGVQVAVLLTFARLWLVTGWPAFFQVFLAEQGFRPVVIGTVLTSVGVGSVAITLASGQIARLASKEVVTIAILALGAFGMALLPHVAVVPLVYVPAFVVGMGTGLSLPMLIAIMGDHAPPGQRGVAMGLRTSANQAASMGAPVVAGMLVPGLGVALGFAASALMLLALLGVCLRLHLNE